MFVHIVIVCCCLSLLLLFVVVVDLTDLTRRKIRRRDRYNLREHFRIKIISLA